jgi:RNA polymerase-binding transcription factor DksA
MSIKEQLINTYKTQLAQIEQLKERECALIKEKVFREKALAFNSEIDTVRNEHLTKLTEKFNEDKNFAKKEFDEKMAQIQKRFEDDKQTIIETSEKRKTDYFASVLQNETYCITSECDKQIAKIKNNISDLEK